MVHNYILLETIGIPVMVYIGLLLFFFICRVLKEVVFGFFLKKIIYFYFLIFLF